MSKQKFTRPDIQENITSGAAIGPALAPGTRGEIIDIKEAARRLHVSPSWIYDKRRRGLLPFRYLQPSPSKYFFDSEDIKDYLASCWRSAGEKIHQ
jgi:predicted DNA-binding transcriptional regulator AlpA